MLADTVPSLRGIISHSELLLALRGEGTEVQAKVQSCFFPVFRGLFWCCLCREHTDPSLPEMSGDYRHGMFRSLARAAQWSQCNEMVLENGFCFIGFIQPLDGTRTEMPSFLLNLGGGGV